MSDDTYTEEDYQEALREVAAKLDVFLTIGLALGKPQHALLADIMGAVGRAAETAA